MIEDSQLSQNPLNSKTALKICAEETICFVHSNTPSGEHKYKRAQLFITPATAGAAPIDKVLVCLLDHGTCEYVPLKGIYSSDVKDLTAEVNTRIVSRNVSFSSGFFIATNNHSIIFSTSQKIFKLAAFLFIQDLRLQKTNLFIVEFPRRPVNHFLESPLLPWSAQPRMLLRVFVPN